MFKKFNFKQGCGAAAGAILDGWSRSQNFFNGGAGARARNLSSGSTALESSTVYARRMVAKL